MYAIRGISGGPIKIGRASDPQRRLNEIKPYSPVPLELLGHVQETPELCEASEHARLSAFRLHSEWFDISPHDLPWLTGKNVAHVGGVKPDYSRPKGEWTHCRRGHEYTPENTYAHPDGRQCKACRRELALARKNGRAA